MITVDVAAHETAASKLPQARAIIGAQDVMTGSAGVHSHVNSSTGRVQAEVPLAGSGEVDQAVIAASGAFEVWGSMTPAERRRLLTRFAELIESNIADFAGIAPLENGMPTMMFDVGHAPRVTQWCAYYAGWADKVEGEVVAAGGPENFEFTLAEPYGVVGHVITWNAPALSFAMKVPASLAAGNTVVIKPAEFTPFSMLRFAELAREAGLPDGVVNVVPGGPEAGEALVRHPGVEKISFTGGPGAARAIMENAARTLKPLLFELGGKSANLVFADVDIEQTAFYCAAFAMNNTGQGCALPTRLLVDDAIYDEFVAAVAGVLPTLPVGDPLDPSTMIGPLVNRAAYERVHGMIDEAVAQRAGSLAVGGDRLDTDGFFVPCTLFTDVDPTSRLAQQEVFGPVLAVMRFRTEDEAVEIANGTEYGLSAYVQTNDLNRAHRLVRRLKAGTVYVNQGTPTACAAAPFGGLGLSGFGREGGKAGLDEFLRIKGVGISVA